MQRYFENPEQLILKNLETLFWMLKQKDDGDVRGLALSAIVDNIERTLDQVRAREVLKSNSFRLKIARNTRGEMDE